MARASLVALNPPVPLGGVVVSCALMDAGVVRGQPRRKEEVSGLFHLLSWSAEDADECHVLLRWA